MSLIITARLLGSPEVLVDGVEPPPELLWRKHLAVCLLLWLAPERRRSRDYLVAMLWADKPERAARHSLNEALRVIRRVAGESAVSSAPEGVCWCGAVSLDLDRLVTLSANDPGVAAPMILGEFCEGFSVPEAAAFEEWLATERRDWTARSVTVLARAAAIADTSGDSHAASDLGARALRLDPFSDLAARAVIRSRWLLGDRGGAMAAGVAFRELLATALGATPDPATTQLLDDIGRSRRSVTAPPIAAPRRPPLIGRSAALTALLEAWHATATGKPASLAVIEGDSGSGRTRLLEELLARASLEGATAVLLRVVDADADDASAGLLAMLHTLLEAPGVSGAPAAALATAAARLPEWAERYPGVRDVDALPLADALAAVLRATSEERPIVVGIDDAGLVDPGTLRAIPVLVRALGTAPVMLVLTLPQSTTDGGADALRKTAGRDRPGTVVRLAPWSSADIDQLVAWSLPGWSSADQERLGRRLQVESGGMPAIAVEVLDAVVHGLALDPASVPWPPPEHTMDKTLPTAMPAALVAALRMAFRRLDTDAQSLLTLAALLPEPFHSAQLPPLLGTGTEADHLAVLDRLEWQCWLVADARGYAFRARAVRRMIAEEMLTPGQRQRLFVRIAAN